MNRRDGHDVFFSYHRGDPVDAETQGKLSLAEALRDALKAQGLRVFFDEPEIEDFESITARLTNALARSRSLLALYSRTYPTRRACQFELTAAFLAAQREGDPRRRILVVNPEAGVEHIEPAELRDELFRRAPAPEDAGALTSLAASVAQHVGTLDGELGDVRALTPPPWFGMRGVSPTRFVGRLDSLWRIHSALHAGELRPMTGVSGPGVAQVRGLGGIGKTLLAEEYALRFGPMYPGGVYWLRAQGDDETGPHAEADHSTTRFRQLRTLALDVGLSPPWESPEELDSAFRAELAQRGLPCLWVVDDVPTGLEADELRRWFAPHPLAKTLFTTRSREYGALAPPVEPRVLSSQEGVELLRAHRRPDGEAEEEAMRGLVEDLGRHALALDIAGAALAIGAGLETFAGFREALASSDTDELELAAELTNLLPSGHEASIATTIKRSLGRLGLEGWDLLRIAGILVGEPVPVSLVADVFAAADQIDERAAIRKAKRALSQADIHSLSEDAGDGERTVHPLIRRTVQFTDNRPDRLLALRAAAISALTDRLAQTDDWWSVASESERLLHRIFTSATDSEDLFPLLEEYARVSVTCHPGRDFFAEAIAREVRLPLSNKLGLLRTLVRHAEGYPWEWGHWRYEEPIQGVASVLAEQISRQPLDCFRVLVEWLDDMHSTTAGEVKVADVAAGLMWRFSDLGFDELCEFLANSGKDRQSLFRELGTRRPERMLAVCELWSASGAPGREALAGWCARKLLFPPDRPRDADFRAVGVLRQLLSNSQSERARNEALAGLMAVDEARDEVFDEIVGRVLGGDTGFSVWWFIPAFQSHFDRVLEVFAEYLEGGGSADEVVKVLGEYRGIDPEQIARVVAEIEQAWNPGTSLDYPVAAATESLLRHSQEIPNAVPRLLKLVERLLREGSTVVRAPLAYFATEAREANGDLRSKANDEVLNLLIETAQTDEELASVLAKLGGKSEWIAAVVSRVLARPLDDPGQFEQRLIGAAFQNEKLAHGLAQCIGAGRAYEPRGIAWEFEALVASGVEAHEAVRQIITRQLNEASS
jgi:hypothetical protein